MKKNCFEWSDLRLTNQCKNNEEGTFQNKLKNEWIISAQVFQNNLVLREYCLFDIFFHLMYKFKKVFSLIDSR